MKKFQANQLKQFAMTQIDRARREVRRHWREMAESEAPSATLAATFATGTLISTIPVPLVDMALAAFVMRRYSHLPRAPFFAAMALTNNLVMAPLYACTPKVGAFALGWLACHTPMVAPEALVVRILVGYLLIAFSLAAASFVVAHTGFAGYRVVRRPQPVFAFVQPLHVLRRGAR